MGSAQADTWSIDPGAGQGGWTATGADPVELATQAGDPGSTGMAHRKARGAAMGLAPALVTAMAGIVCAAARAPVSCTVRPSSRSSTSTEPSWSVRYTSAPVARIRSSVDFAGCPYGLPAPAEAIATRGRTASRNGWVDAVALP